MKTQLQEQSKKCINCGDAFLKGRIDKVYCNDACRIDYNNKLKLEKRTTLPPFVRTIPKIILNNYKILRKLNPDGKTRVSRETLDALGFNPQYITSYYQTQKGDIYGFCFDQGFLQIRDNQVLLVTQQSQVENKSTTAAWTDREQL